MSGSSRAKWCRAIYLSVGPGAEPASDFTIGKIRVDTDTAGATIVATTVTNTGGRALDLAGELSLSDGPALDTGPFRTPRSTTLGIGESTELTIPLDDRIPGGTWKATLTLASGQVEHTRTQQITLPGDAPPADDGGFPLLPVLLAGGASIAVGAAAIALLRRRAR